MTDPTTSPADKSSASPRHPAGADPAKCAEILSGAKEVFMSKGFDAAGVNDICRAAGVSKSTLYVYFDNKEDLFERMVEIERDRLFEGITDILSRQERTADILHAYGVAIVGILCSDNVVKTQRIIIGIAERMPSLGSRFYAGGAMRAQTDLAAYLERASAEGRLQVPDAPLAAAQFIELAAANLWKPRLFGRTAGPPPPEAVETTVDGAVAMFLAAYGRGAVARRSG